MRKNTSAFKTLIQLHSSFVLGQLAFTITTLFVSGTEPFSIEGENFSRTVQVIATIFSVASIFIGFKVFQKKLLRIRKENSPVVERVAQYRRACVTWWILLLTPAFFASLCYVWTNNLSFFILSCMHVILLFLFRPRKDNIVLLLNLNADDVTTLEQHP